MHFRILLKEVPAAGRQVTFEQRFTTLCTDEWAHDILGRTRVLMERVRGCVPAEAWGTCRLIVSGLERY